MVSRPRKSLLELFDPLSSDDLVKGRVSEETKPPSPSPSFESGSDKENICSFTPKGTPRPSKSYNDGCPEALFLRRTASSTNAPRDDKARESFFLDPGPDASNLCLVELADELDKACKLTDESLRRAGHEREPLTEISIPTSNFKSPSSFPQSRKDLISFDTPKHTPKSLSKFASGVSGCDGMSPRVYSPKSTVRSQTPINLLSPSIIITTPTERASTISYKTTTPPISPPFTSPSFETKMSTPALVDSSPRFMDPPASLGRADISSSSLDIRSLGKRLDLEDDLLRQEPSFNAKLDDASFSSEFEFPKTKVERNGTDISSLEDESSCQSSSRAGSKLTSTSMCAGTQTAVPRVTPRLGRLSDSSNDDAPIPRARDHLSRRSSVSPVIGIEQLKRTPIILSSRRTSLCQRKRNDGDDDYDDILSEERDAFDMETYAPPKTRLETASRPIPRASDPKALARSQSLNKRASTIGIAPSPAASGLRSSISRPSLSRRTSIGIQLDRTKSGFDISASQGRDRCEVKSKPSVLPTSTKRLSMSTSISGVAKESVFGTTGRAAARTRVPPSTSFSSTLGRSSGIAASTKIASAGAPVSGSSKGSILSRRSSSIGLSVSHSASSGFQRQSAASIPAPPAPVSSATPGMASASNVGTKRLFTRTASAPSVGAERSRSNSGLSGLSKLTSSAVRAVRKPSERKAF